MRASIPALLCIVLSAAAAERAFTSYAQVKAVLNAERDRLPPALANPTEAKWNAWSREQDKAIRERLQQGDLDSMVNLLLYGTSFTSQPRIRMENVTEASRSGLLRARVDDLAAGLKNPGGNERLVFLASLLQSRGVDTGSAANTGVFLYENLQRVLQENIRISERRAAEVNRLKSTDAERDAAALLDRASLFSDRGVSLDTSILPNFSIEHTLRDLKNRGILHEGKSLRVAVIGPGLDFIDKNEESGYDYYPQQTLQPFALYDSLVRLGLAKANGVSMSIFDISPRVIDHVQRARERAKKNTPYTIQLPRDIARPWPSDLAAFWQTLGDQIGTPVAPIRPPDIFQSINAGRGLETRAVQIRPDVVLACEALDLNVVLGRIELPAANRFDIMVATNIFVYYDPFEQSLALENIGAMLKPGGILLTNDRLPEVPGGTMRLAGVTDIKFGDQGGGKDAVGWYQRR